MIPVDITVTKHPGFLTRWCWSVYDQPSERSFLGYSLFKKTAYWKCEGALKKLGY